MCLYAENMSRTPTPSGYETELPTMQLLMPNAKLLIFEQQEDSWLSFTENACRSHIVHSAGLRRPSIQSNTALKELN